jgi:hypothetical protein
MKQNLIGRIASIIFFTISISTFAIAQQPATPAGAMGADPDRATAGGGIFPSGWSARTDINRRTNTEPPVSQVIFTAIDGGFHTTLGPASTFYNPAWTKTGDHLFSARLTQLKKPTHQIAYGLYVGGSDLSGPNQSYTYFMIRNTGEYLIKTRKGTETPVITNWTPNDVVIKEDANGRQQNTLAIQVQGNDVIFSINGKEVARKTKAELPTDGLYGFRIDHNLDVDIDQIKR